MEIAKEFGPGILLSPGAEHTFRETRDGLGACATDRQIRDILFSWTPAFSRPPRQGRTQNGFNPDFALSVCIFNEARTDYLFGP